MRTFALAAALAALAVAAPAAAQPAPDPAQVLLGAVERMRENVPAGVEEYVMNLTSGPVRSQLYAHRAADGWKVDVQSDGALADLFQGMAIWHRLAASVPPGATSTEVAAAYPGLRYEGTDTVQGRTAHVLMAEVPDLTLEEIPLPGPARIFVDAETRQVLRMSKSSEVEPSEFDPGGHVDMVVTFGGYEAVDGVTLPRRWGMHLRMQTRRPAEQVAAERKEMEQILAELDQLSSEEAAEYQEGRVMIELTLAMLKGEPVEIVAELEEVQVNDRPRWFSEDDS